MSIQKNNQVGFPLAFEIYSYGSIDWDNPPLTREFPYLSEELLEILLCYCLDHSLLEYILFPRKKSLITKPFFKQREPSKLFTDKQKIKQRINYFVRKIVRNQFTVIGTTGDIASLLSLFKRAYWAIEGVSIERAMDDINRMIEDPLTLFAIDKLACKNLLFINHDGEPIYLLQRSHYSQVIDV